MMYRRYCCECPNGNRTVGCCSHVAAVIFYQSFRRYQSKILRPAALLSFIFTKQQIPVDINTDSDDDDWKLQLTKRFVLSHKSCIWGIIVLFYSVVFYSFFFSTSWQAYTYIQFEHFFKVFRMVDRPIRRLVLLLSIVHNVVLKTYEYFLSN